MRPDQWIFVLVDGRSKLSIGRVDPWPEKYETHEDAENAAMEAVAQNPGPDGWVGYHLLELGSFIPAPSTKAA